MEFEAFRVIAQIAAGLAGFVGILLVMQDRLARLPRRQMLGFLQSSIGTLAFALLPDLVFGLPIASELGWRILGGLFGAYHLFIYVFFLSGYGDFKKMPPIQITVCIASIPVIGAKLALGFGLFPAYASNIYHLGLLWTIGVSIFFFVQVILNEASE
ncbi:hypothetical protein [Hyphococcus sp.]|uniref:hypothetical protein n=1 Tax=Hyphococcus sp. TaxID=2038636 RepID=UPI003CCB9B93